MDPWGRGLRTARRPGGRPPRRWRPRADGHRLDVLDRERGQQLDLALEARPGARWRAGPARTRRRAAGGPAGCRRAGRRRCGGPSPRRSRCCGGTRRTRGSRATPGSRCPPARSRPPGRRAARISATPAAGSPRWVSRKRAYTTSYSASPSPSARSATRNSTLVTSACSASPRASSIFVASRSTPTTDPVIPTSEARSNVTSPPPQPTSRQRSPAVTPARSRRARVVGRITRASTRSRSRPAMPPRIR